MVLGQYKWDLNSWGTKKWATNSVSQMELEASILGPSVLFQEKAPCWLHK